MSINSCVHVHVQTTKCQVDRLLEIYANKKQIKRAFEDIESLVSVFLNKTCCRYSLELPWRGDSDE